MTKSCMQKRVRKLKKVVWLYFVSATSVGNYVTECHVLKVRHIHVFLIRKVCRHTSF